MSGVRLQWTLQCPELGCESLLGSGWSPVNNFGRGHPSSQDTPEQHRAKSPQRDLVFAVKRQGGGVILHHRHVRSVLVRDWSPAMDGIQATIWASRTTTDLDYGRPSRTTVSADVRTRVAEIAI